MSQQSMMFYFFENVGYKNKYCKPMLCNDSVS